MTPEDRALRRARRLHNHLATVFGARSLILRSRHSRDIDLEQLYTRDGLQLRILSEGHGAEEADINKMWFVVGYSVVGGEDKIPTGPL